MHPIAEQARIAYAAGWASSGGPMTNRVKVGCAAAVDLACELAGDLACEVDPHILEATLELGALEGTWAAIYERRDLLYDTKTAAVTAALRALLAGIDLAPAIDRFRAATGLAEAQRTERDNQTAEAIAAILALLLVALEDRDDPDYQTLLTTMVNTLRDAQAEGMASAIAIAAERSGVTGIDLDKAFADARAELATAEYLDESAAKWIKTLVEGVATEVGKTVAELAEEGASTGEILADAEDLIDEGDLRSTSLLVDTAMSTALAHGTLTVYTRGGAATVDFMTAADGRVCKICANAENSGPYAVLDAPIPPMHPWCRCVLVPHDPLDPLIFAGYTREV